MMQSLKLVREYLIKSIEYVTKTKFNKIGKKDAILPIIYLTIGILQIFSLGVTIGIVGTVISIFIAINIDNILLILKKTRQWINNQHIKINYRLNLRYHLQFIILSFLPSECQQHFKDETKNILKTHKKYIAYYNIVKLYLWEMLLMRIINDCYLRVKNVIFRGFIK
ncbi:MAG: hypothetical protein AB4372_21755 [Xenococcus sp. (in: cyanobacteria)]